MTRVYSHGGPGWNTELRRAVMLLENGYMVYETVYGPFEAIVENAVSSPKILKPEEKQWWSQRDSNPCLSLERAPS